MRPWNPYICASLFHRPGLGRGFVCGLVDLFLPFQHFRLYSRAEEGAFALLARPIFEFYQSLAAFGKEKFSRRKQRKEKAVLMVLVV